MFYNEDVQTEDAICSATLEYDEAPSSTVALFWTGSASSSSITSIGQRVGVAAYNELESCLTCGSFPVSVIQETLAGNDWTINAMKSALKPSLLILHPKIASNPPLLKLIISNTAHNDDGAQIVKHPNLPYVTVKSSIWNHAMGYNALAQTVSLRSQARVRLRSYSDGHQKFASLIDLDDHAVMSATSALLYHLQSNPMLLAGDEESRLSLASIKPLNLVNTLRIDHNTLTSLQMFSDDVHPSLLKGFGKNKEGFSLFCLFDRTHSAAGKARLREWMKSPFCDIPRIVTRQDGVEMVTRAENIDFTKSIVRQIMKSSDVSASILRIKRVTTAHNEWIKLYQSIEAGVNITRLVLDFLRDPNKADSDKRYLNFTFKGLPIDDIEMARCSLLQAMDIEATLQGFGAIFEQSATGQHSVYIREGFDPALDNLRDIYLHLESILKNAASQTLNSVPILNSVSVQYVPQIGYLVIVRADESHKLDHQSEFTFAYTQDEFSYYKSSVTDQLDEEIGDIMANISDRQKAHLLRLENIILDNEEGLHHLSYIISNLDAIISLGSVASELGFVRPQMTEENILVIKGGRHVLQEMTVETFVKNDTLLTDDKNIALITGPNGSGKSIYIKQVGVLVLLAHIGSFLPCEKAVIGLSDAIFTRISTVDSVISPESTFASDLTQISRMLQGCTAKSLCLIDEFGKGTSPIDGVALLAATIRHFTKTKSKILCVLHLMEIFAEGVVDLSSPTMSCVTPFMMQTYEEPSAKAHGGNEHFYNEEEDEDAYKVSTPLYTLIIGVSPSSQGLACAKNAGVPKSVIDRASEIKRSITSKKEIFPSFDLLDETNDYDQIGSKHRAFKKADLEKVLSLVLGAQAL